MKVLFVSIYDQFKGASGPGNHLRFLSEGLRDLGCEVHVLSCGSQTRDVKINGIIVHYFKPRFLGSIGQGFMFSLLSVAMINQIVKKYGIDVIHGQSPSSFGYAMLSPRKVPFVVTLHGTSFGELSAFSNVPLTYVSLKIIRDALFIQPLTAFLTSFEYKLADRVIAVSNRIAEEAELYYRLPRGKIVVIHNGVNPTSMSDIDKKNAGTNLLFVGRLMWRKGVKFLIDALPLILSDFRDTKLMVVGNGEQKKFLMDLAKTYGLENSVYFLGSVSEEKLFDLYRETDVYLQPSLYEPCPLAILEAMSMGNPIIASNVGGIPELITNGAEGLLVKPENSLELAIAIKRIFSDSSLKESLGRKAREKVERQFTWAVIAEKTLELYATLQNER